MRRRAWLLLFSLCLGLAGSALAAEQGAEAPHADPHGKAAAGHGEEHVPSFHDFNWFHGMLAERADVTEPSLLFRPKGMPVPFAALLLNTALLYYLLYRFLGKSVSEGLKKRKQTILRGMEEAAQMKREAEQQLAAYEAKLAGIDEEVARIHRDMRSAGETERARILSDAREQRTRMERDARLLIEQELKAVREQLIRETMDTAVRSAERALRERLTETDHRAFAEAFLSDVQRAAPALRGRL